MHINLAVADYQVETLLDAGLHQSISNLTEIIDSLEEGDVDRAEGGAMETRDVLEALARLVHGLRWHKAECQVASPCGEADHGPVAANAGTEASA
jgi:hypothetical protein